MAKIYVTGFSCFGAVTSNPTEELIQELTKHVQQQTGNMNKTFTNIYFSLELHLYHF